MKSLVISFVWGIGGGVGSQLFLDSVEKLLKERDLASCASCDFVMGGNGTAGTEGTYIASSGTSNTNYDIYSDNYNLPMAAQYGLNSDPEGNYVNLTEQTAESISFMDTSTSSPNIGEWKVTTDINSKVTVAVDRNGYEIIVMNATSDTGVNTGYDNSNLYNGSSSTQLIYLENTEYITIRAKKLDTSSNYTIGLTQSGTVSPTTGSDAGKYDILLFSVIGIILLGLIGLLITTLSFICFKRGQTKHEYKNYYSKQHKQNAERVGVIMERMKHGKGEEISEQDPIGALGGEALQPDADVHIHQHGDNVFHSRGLDHWFMMIHPKVDIHCPIGHENIKSKEADSSGEYHSQKNTSYEFPKTEYRLNNHNL